MSRRKDNSEIYEELKKKHETDLTKEEKRILEREKLSTMSLGGKLGYIWAYYKLWMVAAVAVICVLSVLWTIYDNSKNNTLLSIAIANAGIGDSDPIAEEFKEFLGDDNSRNLVEVATNMSFPAETVENEDGDIVFSSTSQMDFASQAVFLANISAENMDVLICPESAYLTYRDQGAFADLRELFTEEELAGITVTEDGTAIQAEAEEIPSVTGHLELNYQPIYIMIIENSSRKDMAEEYIRYILNL